MQACARIGATHSVVFGGFSAKSIQERIIDAGAIAVVTADGQFRGGREIALKPVVDEALALGDCESIKTVFVWKRTGSAVPMECEPRRLVARRRRSRGRVRAGGRRRRASALHPLHVRTRRQAERHAPHDRRLPAVDRS